MNNYPIITIPGDVISKKRRYKIVKIGNNYKIALNIKKSILNDIIKLMRRQWGLPVITTPIQIKFMFYIPNFPPNNKVDHDNAKQLYLDLLQIDKYKVERTGKNKGKEYLASSGAGIIADDKLIQSTDGTRFVFLCKKCKWGVTGERRQFTKNKEKMGCPGPKSCKDRRIEIEINDMKLNQEGFYDKK